MTTQVFLGNGGAGVSGYTIALPARGSSVLTAVVNTASGSSSTAGTENIQWTVTAGGSILQWITRPLVAAVTIAGAITVNLWATESNNLANSGVRGRVWRLQPNGTKTQIGVANMSTELTTSIAAQNFSITPTSTAFAAGDRIVLEVDLTNVGGTMGSGRTASLTYAGPTAAASGDSYFTFTETFTFRQPRALTT
jgi:hypothetical protein